MSERLFDPNRVYDDEALAPHTPGQRGTDHRGWVFMFVKASAAAITATPHLRYPEQRTNGQAYNDCECRCWQALRNSAFDHPSQQPWVVVHLGRGADQRGGKLQRGRAPLHDEHQRQA